MSFDHGILNVSLRKRGNIDAQIDAYKAEQAKIMKMADKARAAAHCSEKAVAKAALAEIIAQPGLIDAKAAQFNQPKKVLLSTLEDWAKCKPAQLIDLHSKWITAAGVA